MEDTPAKDSTAPPHSTARRSVILAILLLTIGLWIVSYFNFVYTSGDALCYVYLESGAWVIHWYEGAAHEGSAEWAWLGYDGLDTLILPRLTLYSDKVGVVLPLWLVAAVCVLSLCRIRRIRPRRATTCR